MRFAHIILSCTLFVQLGAPLILAEEAGSGAVVPLAEDSDALEDSEDPEEALEIVEQHSSESSESSVALSLAMSPLAVRISEVLWVGSDVSTADEWLEITAFPAITGAVLSMPLPLTGWTVRSVKDGQEIVIANLSNITVESGSYIVLSNYDAPQSRLKKNPAVVTSAMSLPNTKLQLRLRDGSGALIDEVDDAVGNPFAGGSIAGGIKASMERINLRGANISSNWMTAATMRGLDAGSLVRGTPGYPNATVEPPDAEPPEAVLDLQLYRWSGSLLISWSPSRSEDLASQRLILNDASMVSVHEYLLPATATGLVLPDNPSVSAASVRSFDESGNYSDSEIIRIEPLHKPIISELMPDPPGSETNEWIELKNEYDFDIPLQGWTLKSGSSKYAFTGAILHAGAIAVIPSSVHHLGLPNSGGELTLWFMGRIIDRLPYTAVPDGVSVARMTDSGLTEPSCVATAGMPNDRRAPKVSIEGIMAEVDGSKSLNLNAVSTVGSIAGATCSWNFGDGYIYAGCNPPSHKMKTVGDLIISLEVKDYCGNTMKHSENVRVVGKAKNVTLDTKKVLSCIPSTFSGVTITELFPSPEISDQEWIEIRNTGSGSLSLCGWSIDDQVGGSKPFSLDTFSMGPGEYLSLPRSDTKIALNDDQDMARLIAPLPSGGTGVLITVAFQDAPKNESFAIRDDHQWLWTRFATPGIINRFQEVDMTLASSPVVLEAALPNPKGVDIDEEWIELRNLSMAPQWLNGWALLMGDRSMDLQGTVLARKEVLRLSLRKQPISLTNEMGTLKLVDPDGNIRSILGWKKAKDDQVIRRFDPQDNSEAGTGAGLFLAGVDTSGLDARIPSIFNKYESIYSSLIHKEKVELKNDSITGGLYAFADGADVASLLLQLGFAYVTGRYEFDRKWEFLGYEEEARKQKRGIWSQEEMTSFIDEWRTKQQMDAKAQDEGVVLEAKLESGLVESGAVLALQTNVPAKLFLMTGTGSVEIGTGIVIHRDSSLVIAAEYGLQTESGAVIRSTVLTRNFVVKRDSYPSCIGISEVYPSPEKGESEWIELYNKCDQEISLAYWSVDDELEKGSKPVKFPFDAAIRPYGLYVLSGSSIAFNNGGDGAAILDPLGRVQDIVRYPLIGKGLAYAFVEDSWCSTSKPTIGAFNDCVVPSKKKAATKIKTASPKIGLRTVFQDFEANLAKDNRHRLASDNFAQLEVLDRKKILEESLGGETMALIAGLILMALGGSAFSFLKRK